jgi:CBS domain containing-hemolysin-like protein
MDAGGIFLNLFIIAILLMSNAFFVAAEFSMVSVRKTRIAELTKDGNFNAKVALETLQDLDRFVAAVQLGVTISSIGLGWVGEGTLARMLFPIFNFIPVKFQFIAVHSISTTVAFILITVLHVVTGELVPKSIALQYPEKTSLFIAIPMKFISKIFDPFISVLNGLGKIILKVLKIPHVTTSHLAHSIEELNMLINASYKEGVLNETEKDMLHNVFKFSDLTAKQVMIPRTDMACVPSDISYEELSKITSENQYTRYPVYEDNLDHITGIIHVKDLYVHSIKKDTVFSVKQLLRPVLLVPETITMDNLVREFKKCQGQMAIVIDEFGGTSGLITLEDVLEEIFGEVQDEFDADEEADIKEIGQNTYLTNAMMRIDEINEFFNLEIDEEDVDTIGGLALKELGRIALVGDKVRIENLNLTVKEIDGARITKLIIVKKDLPDNKDEETTESNSEK